MAKEITVTHDGTSWQVEASEDVEFRDVMEVTKRLHRITADRRRQRVAEKMRQLQERRGAREPRVQEGGS